MKDFRVTKHNLDELFDLIVDELTKEKEMLISSQSAGTGKWGMARLWRKWMSQTAEFMKNNGVTMPTMLTKDGRPFGEREFNAYDAHELFTGQWLYFDEDGDRLSWSKDGRDGMRAATKGERFIAMQRHEQWALEKGIALFNPSDSEYRKIQQETEK